MHRMRGPKALYEKQQESYAEKTLYSLGFAAWGEGKEMLVMQHWGR